jgi:hypothetical protein
MKHGKVILAIAFTLFLAATAFAKTPKPPEASDDKKPYALPDLTQLKFTGDLDVMIKRRYIRVLVNYSKTHYFVDRGTQRGLVYEFGRMLQGRVKN